MSSITIIGSWLVAAFGIGLCVGSFVSYCVWVIRNEVPLWRQIWNKNNTDLSIYLKQVFNWKHFVRQFVALGVFLTAFILGGTITSFALDFLLR